MVIPVRLDRRLLVRVLDAFRLGEPLDVRRLPVGTMNHNWRVETPRGTYAVKQVLDTDVEGARLQHAVMGALADQGFPVPRPVRTATGESLAVLDDSVFSVLPWIEGAHRPGHELTLDESTEFGALLGELQMALKEVLPATDRYVAVVECRPESTLEQIETYLARIDGPAGPDEFDGFVKRRLHERRELLVRWAAHRPSDGMAGPVGWIHGDFHHNNVLWSGGKVAAVLDWDRLRPAPVAEELVRSATLAFGCKAGRVPDLTRIRAYARGYRSVVSLPDAAIADAADRRWWSNLTGLWPLRLRYERDDTSCDHLFPEQCDLVAWWCENRAAFTHALLR